MPTLADTTKASRPPSWTAPGAPRIWRSPNALSFQDEPLAAATTYTDEKLARIAEEGFTGIWLFCLLRDLMRSKVFPELNVSNAEERVASIQTVIERGRKHGIGVHLYFNDPVGLDVDHPFWKTHPDLKGVTLWHMYSFCTSTPLVQAFFRDAVGSVFRRLHDPAGVFLITACESLTHCWSKSNTRRGAPPPTCPRCREREPADLVLELLSVWADVRRQQANPFRLMGWNWEWSYWYPDPQAEITTRLPDGVELLLDMEIGGTRPWGNRTNYLGEYSLGYTGPSQRFVATEEAVAAKRIPIHAKIQINNTHEMCSVPNLPVLATLHGKFKAMVEHGVAGFLGTWSMGTRFSLNTYAHKLFLRDPQRFCDAQVFLDRLAREYFGLNETESVIRAWKAFSKAWQHYPFTVQMLYHGPHNDAPARRFSLRYEGKPIGRSWVADEPGDDLGPCLQMHRVDSEGFTLDEVIEGFTRMCEGWEAGLGDYEAALELGDNLRTTRHPSPVSSPARGEDDSGARFRTVEQGGVRNDSLSPHGRGEGEGDSEDVDESLRRVTDRRREELGVARMIGIQLRSTLNAFRFYREQIRVMKHAHLTPPCELPADAALLAIIREEIANAERALPLVESDPRLGYHEDCGYKYDAQKIREKIAAMKAELDPSAAR